MQKWYEPMRPQVLFIFVDGLGLGPDDPAINPVVSGACPVLARLLAEAIPLDATLGVPGTPQSATGQTALLTGINAAQAMGRHCEGFPGPDLRAIVRQHNLFSQLAARGLRSTFANAYYLQDITEVQARRKQSVTTVATLAAFNAVRDAQALLENRAVFHDLTRASLRPRGYTAPLITPADAAQHLLGIAAEHDFTLFEFFLTDLAGHARDNRHTRQVLARLDQFLAGLLEFPDPAGRLLVVTSDHGNVEDARTSAHTINPVPLVARGARAADLQRCACSLLDVTPALVGLLAAPPLAPFPA